MKRLLTLLLLPLTAYADFFSDKLNCMNDAVAHGSRADAAVTCAAAAVDSAPDKRKTCATTVAKRLDAVYYWTVKIDQDVAHKAADNACAQSYDVEKAVACIEGLYGKDGVPYSMKDASQACMRGNSAAHAKDCIEGLSGLSYAGGESVNQHLAAVACASTNGYGVLQTCLKKFAAMSLKSKSDPHVHVNEAALLCSRLAAAPDVTQSADVSADSAQ